MTEPFPSMHEVLGSIPSTTDKTKQSNQNFSAVPKLSLPCWSWSVGSLLYRCQKWWQSPGSRRLGTSSKWDRKTERGTVSQATHTHTHTHTHTPRDFLGRNGLPGKLINWNLLEERMHFYLLFSCGKTGNCHCLPEGKSEQLTAQVQK
jgi:hypothetical protein